MSLARLALLFALALPSAACFGRTRPCRALPVPSPSVFERCGGMLYHAPPNSSARYTIRFVNKVGADFQLTDVCVLLDGAPIFGTKEVADFIALSPDNQAKLPAEWTGKLADVRHTLEVQLAFSPRIALEGEEVTKTYTIYLRAAQELAASDGAVLELIAEEEGDPKGSPSERLTIHATLPAKSSQPRCE